MELPSTIKEAFPALDREEDTQAVYKQEPCSGNPDMAPIQLAVTCLALWAFLPCQGRDCLSRCCSITEVDRAGHQLMSRLEGPKYMPTSPGCQASSQGDVSMRSISPWRYEKDEDSTRYPSRLWQARCNCPKCIVLKPSPALGKYRNETSPFGNSAVVNYTTIVFRRTRCKEEPHRFQLVPELYSVNVSCTCVIPEKAS